MTRLERIRQSRHIARVWVLLSLFAIRAVVPLGYMPAPIGEGGPFALCHGMNAETIALLGSNDAMHVGTDGMHGAEASHGDHSDDPASGHDEGWEHCPLGIGAADAAMAFAAPFALTKTSNPSVAAVFTTHSASASVVRYRVRAPPA